MLNSFSIQHIAFYMTFRVKKYWLLAKLWAGFMFWILLVLISTLYIRRNFLLFLLIILQNKNLFFFHFLLIICLSNMLLWHKRLGHICYFVLQHLQLCKHDFDICVLPCDVSSICRDHMLSFPESFIQSYDIFYLIYVDISGHISKSSSLGAHHVLIIVDYYNRATWTFLHPNNYHTIKFWQNIFND